MIEKIKKRDGKIVPFNKEKISNAIWKAARSVGGKDRSLAEKLADEVVKLLEKSIKPGEIPTVEQVQDIVEKVLVENGHYKTAKAYITYRKKKEEIRKEKIALLGEFYDEKVAKRFSVNAIRLMVTRYLLKNENREIIEGPKQMFQRVAMLIVIPDILYDPEIFDKEGKQEKREREEFNPEGWDGKLGFDINGEKITWNKYHLERMKYLYDELNKKGKMKVSWSEFFEMLKNGKFEKYSKNFLDYFNLMIDKKFIPNSPTLFNAGAALGQLSACFVIDMDDNMESIMDAAKHAAIIFKSGGGIGINYSKLRPEGDVVATTGGVASGPVSFMRIVDVVTDVVKQGGKRRGANMGILESWHPDVYTFIHAKGKEGVLENFNISVMVDDNFWKAYNNKDQYALINPRTNKPVAYTDPEKLLDEIAYMAWKTADPGVLFLDNINARNVQKEKRGLIRATNPCVTGDTFVLTKRGLIKAKELNENDLVWTLEGWKRIEKVYDNGIKDVYRVTLKNGLEIKVTRDHKFFTKEGWKEVNRLKEGEEIRIVLEEPENFGIKSEFNEEIAEFLGNWVGDGSLSSSGHVSLHVGEDYQLVPFYQNIMNEIGGHAFSFQRGSQFVVDTHRVKMKDFIRKFFGTDVSRSRKKFVPNLMLRQPKSIQAAFLRGLFTADGSVYDAKGTVTISLSSSSKKLLSSVQLMLLSFGIFSVLTKEKKPEMKEIKGKKYSTKGTWRLLICGADAKKFAEKINFRGLKANKLKKMLKNKKFYKKSKEFQKIVKIEYIGKERVYDIKSPPTYTWTTNGIYSYDCGEQPLYPYESCNLGSINLYAFVKFDDNADPYFDWEEFRDTIRLAYRFLDNVIDVNKYPIPEIDKASKAVRRVGLGFMGLADTLFALEVPYNSEDGFDFTRKVSEWLTYYSMLESVERAKTRGVFDLYSLSSYSKGEMPVEGFYHDDLWTLDWKKLQEEIMKHGIRNVEVTTVAPTGSISMFFDVSSGVEPQFALVYEKRVVAGQFFYTDLEFERQLKVHGLFKDEILKKVSENGGSVQGLEEIPEHLRKIFVTSLDIPWWDHIRAEAVAQLWITSSISKTINMPEWVTVDDVKKAYMVAHAMGCKGVTIYREKSKSKQVIYLPGEVSKKRIEETLKLIKNKTPEIIKELGIEMPEWYYQMTGEKYKKVEKTEKKEEIERCPVCGSMNLAHQGGCVTCLDCGWSECVIA